MTDEGLERPNVIVVMTDQHRADVCAREGFELDTTPFLDSLARDGTWFGRAYSPYPMCVPARTSFLTGRFPSWTGVHTNDTTVEPRYRSDLFDVMDEQGYETSLCGKNHSYLEPDSADHWYEVSHLGGNPRTEAGERWDEWVRENAGMGYSLEPCPGPAEATPVGRIVSESIDWLRSDHERPVFQWLSIPEPHPPYQVPEPYFSTFSGDDVPDVDAGCETLQSKGYKYELVRQFAEKFTSADTAYDDVLSAVRALYYGMLRMVDDQIRRLVDALESAGLRRNTLLVFTSDHGDYVGEYGMMRKTAGVPESLVRIPLFFVGPGVTTGPEPHPAHVSLADVMPTLCTVAGADIPPGVQGRSLLPLLQGDQYPEAEFDSVYTEVGYGGGHTGDDTTVEDPDRAQFHALSGTIRGIRSGDLKLTFDMQGDGSLYELSSDPAETRDRYRDSEYAEQRQALLEDLLIWQLRLDALDTPQEVDLTTHPLNYWTVNE